jgi:predicted nucleic acid-binding protein
LLPETTDFYAQWRSLLCEFTVHGKLGHDAHLVAGMKASGVAEILTFNDGDFVRFTGITVVNPKNVPAG